jgi:hypothetical protein
LRQLKGDLKGIHPQIRKVLQVEFNVRKQIKMCVGYSPAPQPRKEESMEKSLNDLEKESNS